MNEPIKMFKKQFNFLNIAGPPFSKFEFVMNKKLNLKRK